MIQNNPLFQFQYAVLNLPKWDQGLIFELNGIKHALHWDNACGWVIDQRCISEDPQEAYDDFFLFELIAESLDPEDYPAVRVIKRLQGISLSMRRNPGLEDELEMLEEDYFDQPPYMQKKDLIKINEIREKLGLSLVDEDLNPIQEEADFEEEEEIIEEEPEEIDPHAEARELYEAYLEKEEMMRPHREYCRKMIDATASVGGKTPVMPLAIMGTGGGPILCDVCEKQFPLEGGKYDNKGAREAWDLEGGTNPRWVSYIRGHVTFLQETNNTFRAYHGYENSGCGGKATTKDELDRKEFNKTSKPVPYNVRRELNAFLQEELGMDSKKERNFLIQRILDEMFSYDPGIGVNRPD